jgi:hypothetical protein
MTSPRFDEELDVKYILVNTNYNNRALADPTTCDVMFDAMGTFAELCVDEKFPLGIKGFCDRNVPQPKIKKHESVYIIPPCEYFRLLYTVQSGYTWIDVEEDDNRAMKDIIYPNVPKSDNYKIVREKFSKILDDSGCFVFEFISAVQIPFRTILFDFIKPLTKMKFCGTFCMQCLYKITYHEDIKAIIFSFDTESG